MQRQQRANEFISGDQEEEEAEGHCYEELKPVAEAPE